MTAVIRVSLPLHELLAIVGAAVGLGLILGLALTWRRQ